MCVLLKHLLGLSVYGHTASYVYACEWKQSQLVTTRWIMMSLNLLLGISTSISALCHFSFNGKFIENRKIFAKYVVVPSTHINYTMHIHSVSTIEQCINENHINYHVEARNPSSAHSSIKFIYSSGLVWCIVMN